VATNVINTCKTLEVKHETLGHKIDANACKH